MPDRARMVGLGIAPAGRGVAVSGTPGLEFRDSPQPATVSHHPTGPLLIEANPQRNAPLRKEAQSPRRDSGLSECRVVDAPLSSASSGAGPGRHVPTIKSPVFPNAPTESTASHGSVSGGHRRSGWTGSRDWECATR